MRSGGRCGAGVSCRLVRLALGWVLRRISPLNGVF